MNRLLYPIFLILVSYSSSSFCYETISSLGIAAAANRSTLRQYLRNPTCENGRDTLGKLSAVRIEYSDGITYWAVPGTKSRPSDTCLGRARPLGADRNGYQFLSAEFTGTQLRPAEHRQYLKIPKGGGGMVFERKLSGDATVGYLVNELIGGGYTKKSGKILRHHHTELKSFPNFSYATASCNDIKATLDTAFKLSDESVRETILGHPQVPVISDNAIKQSK